MHAERAVIEWVHDAYCNTEHTPGPEPCPPPWSWLESTRRLQSETYGHVLPMHGDALADYVLQNALALTHEMYAEVLNEVGWKPWAQPRGWVNRDAYVKELVDVGHFLANLLVAVGCTDAEWEERYRAKQDLNQRRQDEGYDGVTTKCHACRRALDDVGFVRRDNPRRPGTFVFACGGCGALLYHEDVVNGLRCPRCGRKLADMGFVAPEVMCDGTWDGCGNPDLNPSS